MMRRRATGIYREPEFSPGKVKADAAILDTVLRELAASGVDTRAVAADAFAAGHPVEADIILAMCQGGPALSRLAEAETAGVLAVNSAHAIRNCYRDRLGGELARARVPVPKGSLVSTSPPIDLGPLAGLNLDAGVYVKRGDLHALGPGDVERTEGREGLLATLEKFWRRGVRYAFVQQAVEGRTVKFYGVSGDEFFTIVADEHGTVADGIARALSESAQLAASALGLQAWGGDAVLSGGGFAVIDFNDWPSYGHVRREAAEAIARRALALLNGSR